MAISRPFLLAVLGAALLAATFLAVQNARNRASEEAVPVAQQAPAAAEAPAAQATPAASPVDTLRSSLSGKLQSAAFDVRVRLSGGPAATKAELTGAFERGAANDVPAVDLDARLDAPGQSFAGGFVAVEEKAYLTQGARAWQVPAQAWDPVVQAVADGTGAQPGQLPFEVHPETWVRDAKTVGTEQLDGIDTTHVSASVDVEAMARDLSRSVPAGFGAGGTGAVRRLGGIGPDPAPCDRPRGLRLRRPAAHEHRLRPRPDRGQQAPEHRGARQRARRRCPAAATARRPRPSPTGLAGLTGTEPLSLAALSTDNPKGRPGRWGRTRRS